jgi:hypothetical protein
VLPELLGDEVPWKFVWTEEMCSKAAKTKEYVKPLRLLFDSDPVDKMNKQYTRIHAALERLSFDDYKPSEKNTCIIDWHPFKSKSNPKWTGIFPSRFEPDMAKDDNVLCEGGRLWNYLLLMYSWLSADPEKGVNDFVHEEKYARNSPWETAWSPGRLAEVAGEMITY